MPIRLSVHGSKRQKMPLRNLFAAGGVVMWPLLGFSVLAIALIIEQHKRIVDGIEAGDPTVAAAAMRSHLREITLSLPNIASRFPEMFETD